LALSKADSEADTLVEKALMVLNEVTLREPRRCSWLTTELCELAAAADRAASECCSAVPAN
jgi:hypothetical protein